MFAGGYVQDSGFAAGVLNGILNPFGLQNSAGKAYLESVALRGKVQDAKATTTAFDLKASRELIRLSGGPLAMALGAEIRHEKSDFNVNRDIAGQAGSSGLSGSLSKNGSRNIKAVFGELSIPVMKKVDVQAAMRYDDYDDVGRTANPKVGVRWQPSPRIMLRGSASTGFRAPTLFERNAPQSRNETNNSLNDPILCPSGVPQPGANPLRDCGLQQFKLQGGNPDLTPEKSKTFSVGAVIEPASNLTVAIDYWAISLKDKIGNVPELTLFGNFERYRARFLRNPDGSPFAVLDLYENLGKVRTNGVDLSLTGTTRHMDYGDFSLKIDGTWVHKYEYQNERDGDYIQNVGRYADLFPIFRWKHNLSLTWRSTTWSATLSQNFRTGYVDQNQVDPILFNRVSSYQLWNLSGTYAASKSLTLTAGIKNLFDRDPPFTNQGSTFQQGYDPRFTDPGGRALYLRGSVDF
ncbi:TonB-dependent receptor domain-containing protein [Pseudoduganella sp. RAF53_2]|uniref:TonB-dependent receptor domain-containing protein n=1 Tax=Pseudoduganella sp. RAF53_2 TaxID=3233060 RepID=UPI003F9AB08C